MRMDKIKKSSACCQSHFQSGQAMSEFVILLTVLMILAAGMIYVARLLSFQFWARQEARFIAFQQTWPARVGNVVPGIMPLNTADKGAPTYIRRTFPNRNSNIHCNLQCLIALNKKATSSNNNGFSDGEIFLANQDDKSIWDRKTSEWYDDLKNTIIPVAYAKNRDIGPADSWEVSPKKESELEQGFIGLLEEGQFGEKFCRSMVQLLKDYGFKAESSTFANQNCPKDYNTLLGVHLARNVNFRNLFAHYGKLLDAKKSPQQALQMIGTREIRNQFYSLFDKRVKNAMKDAMEFLSQGAEANSAMVTASFGPILLKAKYKGGKNAVQALLDFADPIHNYSSARKVQAELQREIIRNKVLHADVFTDANWGPKSFHIDSAYAPIPGDFTKVQAAFFDGVMKNVLAKESNLESTLINHTNIQTEISYPPAEGLFPYLFGRFAMVSKPLSAKFFIFDQPWFIPRQITKTTYHWQGIRRLWRRWRGRFYPVRSYHYRELGTEDDLMSAETEEAMMRRRIFGLWLVPSDAKAMYLPLANLAGSSEIVDVIGAGGELLNAPGFAKDQLSTLLDGEGLPLLSQLLNAVNSIPEIIGFDFTPPVLPAVRPQAYPNSKELKEDNLMGAGTNRTMDDYRNEQKANINNKP